LIQWCCLLRLFLQSSQHKSNSYFDFGWFDPLWLLSLF
jgi:hypothetical protein